MSGLTKKINNCCDSLEGGGAKGINSYHPGLVVPTPETQERIDTYRLTGKISLRQGN